MLCGQKILPSSCLIIDGLNELPLLEKRFAEADLPPEIRSGGFNFAWSYLCEIYSSQWRSYDVHQTGISQHQASVAFLGLQLVGKTSLHFTLFPLCGLFKDSKTKEIVQLMLRGSFMVLNQGKLGCQWVVLDDSWEVEVGKLNIFLRRDHLTPPSHMDFNFQQACDIRGDVADQFIQKSALNLTAASIKLSFSDEVVFEPWIARIMFWTKNYRPQHRNFERYEVCRPNLDKNLQINVIDFNGSQQYDFSLFA